MNLSKEHVILVSIYIISTVALILLHRKQPIKTHTVFLFHQLPTWIFGLIVVEAGWVSYPFREFRTAAHTSFVFEFLAFPVIACYFIAFFPEYGNRTTKLLYYALFSLGVTIPEIIFEKYTRVIHYVTWYWYWSFISIWVSFFITRVFCRWFFGGKKKV